MQVCIPVSFVPTNKVLSCVVFISLVEGSTQKTGAQHTGFVHFTFSISLLKGSFGVLLMVIFAHAENAREFGLGWRVDTLRGRGEGRWERVGLGRQHAALTRAQPNSSFQPKLS